MRRCSSPELGSYVLELAGVVMGVAVFIVGAADITRIFQARSAVRAAVNDGARCLFPTDAACVEGVSRGLSAPGRTFNVWVWGSGYEVPQESYLLSARWQQEPVYEVPALQDEIVDVTVERRQFQYRQYSMLYPTTAHTTYLLQTRFLPVVVGGRPLNPHFADPLTLKISHPNATYGLERVSGTTTKRVTSALKTPYHETLRIGSVSFSVKDAWPTMEEDKSVISGFPADVKGSLSCWFGDRQPSLSGEVLNWSAGTHQECRYRVRSSGSSRVMDQGVLKVPMMFRIEGDSRGTVEDAEGKVMIALSWQSPSGGAGRVELGGRKLGHWGGGNFVPRGLAEVDINAPLRSQYADYEEELGLYYELPLLPVDASVTLDFYLVSFNNRRVTWNGGKLEVWLPQYRLVHERQECGYTRNPELCSRPPSYAPVHYVTMTDGAPFKTETSGGDRCSTVEDTSAERDLATAVARLQAEVSHGGAARPYSFQARIPTSPEVCAPQVSTKACSARLPEYFEGCAASEDLDQIAERCGELNPSSRLIHYTKRSVSRALKKVRGCSDRSLPLCAMGKARQVETMSYDGEASCSVAVTSSPAHMIIGPLNTTICQPRDAEVQRIYRSREKIPMDIPISVVRLPSPSLFSAEPPGSSCTPYLSAEGSSREMICGRGLSEAAAERCCAASEGRCRKESVVPPSDAVGDGVRLSVLAAARQRVVEAVQVGYPPARYQEVCEDSDLNCLEVTAALVANESQALVSAKVNVPLMLFSFLNKDWATVEHATTRQLERVVVG